MHTTDKKQQFIQLRADGQTLSAIAKTLQVSKTTLWRWDKEEEDHIRELQLVAQEQAEEEWHNDRLDRLTDLQVCSSFLHDAMTKEISERAEGMSLKEMFLYQNLLRAEMEHYRVKPIVNSKSEARTHSTKTEQNGTILPQNGTRLSSDSPDAQPHLSMPLPAMPLSSNSQSKTEQNGTENPENGTSASPGPESEISNSESVNRCGGEKVQNGTIPAGNGTMPQP